MNNQKMINEGLSEVCKTLAKMMTQDIVKLKRKIRIAEKEGFPKVSIKEEIKKKELQRDSFKAKAKIFRNLKGVANDG